MEGWHDFFVAQAGAAVAFAGLVLVSISINLERIIKAPGLIGRSGEPLAILFTLFVASSVLLVPDRPTWVYGLAVLGPAILFTVVIALLFRNQRAAALEVEASGKAPRGSFRAREVLSAVTCAFLLGAGVVLAEEPA